MFFKFYSEPNLIHKYWVSTGLLCYQFIIKMILPIPSLPFSPTPLIFWFFLSWWDCRMEICFGRKERWSKYMALGPRALLFWVGGVAGTGRAWEGQEWAKRAGLAHKGIQGGSLGCGRHALSGTVLEVNSSVPEGMTELQSHAVSSGKCMAFVPQSWGQGSTSLFCDFWVFS